MKYNDEPGQEEDFFGLVHRGLKEELGLDPSDYGEATITWLGWSAHAAGFAVVAIVRSCLPAAEIDRRRGGCHSVYEHDHAAWLRPNRRTISDILVGRGAPDHGTWVPHTKLIVTELWRWKSSRGE